MTDCEPLGTGVVQPSIGPRPHQPRPYEEPQYWEDLGLETSDGELAAVAVAWIKANLGFLVSEARRRECDQPTAEETVSLMAYRASRGKGLVNSLRRHATGEDLIREPKAILLKYLNYALREVRRARQVRLAHESSLDSTSADLPTDPVPTPPAPGGATVDIDVEIDAGYNRLIRLLEGELDSLFGVPQPVDGGELRSLYAYLDKREALLADIFSRYAPEEVCTLAKTWDDDERRCVLLGVFPLALPIRAVAGYRVLRSMDTRRTINEATTGRMIRTLRHQIEDAWPCDQVPRSNRTEAASHVKESNEPDQGHLRGDAR